MAIEIYRHKRRKPFIPDKTNFTRENYQIIGWNEYEHRFNTTPDYRVNELTPKGFSKNIDLYACWKEISYYNIYFFNDNPNLIRTDYISSDSSNNFFVIGTSEQDLLSHEEQTDINYVVYPQKPNYTILPSPETIGLEIPEGCQFDKWIDANDSKEYNIGDRIQNNGYDKILYMKFEEYDNLIDDQQNDIVDNNYLDIEISK